MFLLIKISEYYVTQFELIWLRHIERDKTCHTAEVVAVANHIICRAEDKIYPTLIGYRTVGLAASYMPKIYYQTKTPCGEFRQMQKAIRSLRKLVSFNKLEMHRIVTFNG